MLVELWDFSVPSLVETLGEFCAGACSVWFAKEFCGSAISGWTS